jgi:hypothetical protein
MIVALSAFITNAVVADGVTIKAPGVQIRFKRQEKSGARITAKWCFTGGLATGSLVSFGLAIANAAKAADLEKETEYLRTEYQMADSFAEKLDAQKAWESALKQKRSSEKRSRIWLLVGGLTGAAIAPVQILF